MCVPAGGSFLLFSLRATQMDHLHNNNNNNNNNTDNAKSLDGDNWNLQKTPRALASPSFSVQRCFGASTLYYILSDPHGYLSPDDAVSNPR